MHTLRSILETECWDCEYCGLVADDTLKIELDGVCIWERFRGGHFGEDHQTEQTVLDCMLSALLDQAKSNYSAQSVDGMSREQWAARFPGSTVSSDASKWADYCAEVLQQTMDFLDQVRDACVNLPDDEWMQARMIALWIESFTGDQFKIEHHST